MKELKPRNRTLDHEWQFLILEAKRIGISKELIKFFLKQKIHKTDKT